MEKYNICFLAISISMHAVSAQNLVLNPGFEKFSTCPEDINTNKRELIPEHWFSPSSGTPDYFNSCSRFNVSVPVNLMGTTFAAEGNAYVGLILLEKPDYHNFNKQKPFNYREYISTKLNGPLLKDSLYTIKFKFAIADFSTYAVNGLGLALSSKISYKLKGQPLQNNPVVQLNVGLDTLIQSVWYTITEQYMAIGNENYLTIGNFNCDKETQCIELDYSQVPKSRMARLLEDGYAYYYIDDVSVFHHNLPDGNNSISEQAKQLP